MCLNVVISMCTAEDMDRKDMELRKTIRTLWPIHAKKMQNLLVPPNEGNLCFLRLCGARQPRGSMPDSQSREPGSNPLLLAF